MRSLMIIIGLLVSGSIVAAGAPVANQFTAGDPIVASDINANFQELADRIGDSGLLRNMLGFSTGTTTGNKGIKVLTELCAANFVGSRICTSEEVVKTIDFSNLPTTPTNAWVQPVLTGSGNGATSNEPTIDVYAGISRSSARAFSCNGWSDVGATIAGLTIDINARFRTINCDTASSVACCL